MRKSVLFAATIVAAASVFAGCTRVTNKLNRMFGGATPVPAVAPAVTPAPTAMPSVSPKASMKPAATPAPKLKKM